MDSIVPQLLLCWVVIFTVINLTFGLSQKIRNAGIVDVLWGFSFCAVTIFFTLTGDGDENRRIFLAVATSLWSGRLGIYLLMRWKALHPIEDKRYAELRQKWGANANLYMFGMFHWQGALIMIFSPIFAVPTWNPNTGMSLVEWIGLAIVAIAIVGESIADWQLARFKKQSSNEVCQSGFWKYSRHPNYFFQWIAWMGFFLFALGSGVWWTFYCPLLMLFLLVMVFGIPANEKHNLESKGEAYKRYQQTTSSFIPWPRSTKTT